MRKVKHTKIRNTGLLFEFILRQLTSDMLNNQESKSTVNLLKHRFNENTQLGKELSLYNVLINKKFEMINKLNILLMKLFLLDKH